jgi:hypothetical protein
MTMARILAKIYEINPYICPKCGSEMKVIAVIQYCAAAVKAPNPVQLLRITFRLSGTVIP